jgi:hypothetical protein
VTTPRRTRHAFDIEQSLSIAGRLSAAHCAAYGPDRYRAPDLDQMKAPALSSVFRSESRTQKFSFNTNDTKSLTLRHPSDTDHSYGYRAGE